MSTINDKLVFEQLMEEQLKLKERLKIEERVKMEEADMLLINDLFSTDKNIIIKPRHNKSKSN